MGIRSTRTGRFPSGGSASQAWVKGLGAAAVFLRCRLDNVEQILTDYRLVVPGSSFPLYWTLPE